MATTYTSTVQVNVWKEHTCARCGACFCYLFTRKKTGRGGTPDAASAAAQAAVLWALTHEVDAHPCPGCGLYQPDMVAAARSRRHWYLVAATAAALLALLILGGAEVLPLGTASWVAAGLGLLALLGHFLVDFRDPNADLESNQRRAQALVGKGDLWLPDAGRAVVGPSDEVGTGRTSAHTVLHALLGLGVLFLLSAELLRAAGGWPLNPGWYPAVAGPGDEPCFYFPQKVTSVKGLWKGAPSVHLLNGAEVGLPGPLLPATSRSASWGDTITIGSREAKTSTNTPWLRLPIPPTPSLAGKTLELRMKLIVNYPALIRDPRTGADGWENGGTELVQRVSLRLASPQAGGRYLAWWWGGMLGGALLLLLPGVLLARLSDAFGRQALPTRIFAPGQDEGDPDRPANATGPDQADAPGSGGEAV